MNKTTLQGILVVGVSFLSTALCVGSSQYGFALFIEPLENGFGWSRTEISASLSFAAVSGLAAPFIGRAMDRYGARPILAISLGLTAISFALRPFMTELWHWYALSFLQFIAFSGATILPMGKLVATWFARSRGRAMGFAAMGNNFGGLTIVPLMTVVLANGDWKMGFSVLTVIAIGLIALSLLFVKEHPPLETNTDSQSRSPIAKSRAKPKRSAAKALSPDEGMTVREAVRTRAFYAVLLAIMFGSFTYSTILPHVFAHLANEGVTAANASFSLTTLAIGGICGKLLFGYLAEGLGARVAAMINLAGQSAFACLLAVADIPSTLVILAPAFGLFMGGFGVLISLLVQDTFGLRFFGSIMGLINASHVVSFGLGPIIAGLSFDLTGAYTDGFLLTAGLFALGCAALTLIPRNTGEPGS